MSQHRPVEWGAGAKQPGPPSYDREDPITLVGSNEGEGNREMTGYQTVFRFDRPADCQTP
jgi:hypothetical protein